MRNGPLLCTALGAASLTRGMLPDLRINTSAVQHNLEATGGVLLAERVATVLTPLVGGDHVQELLCPCRA